MLYELIAATRVGRAGEVKEIARMSGSIVLAHNGVVRSLKNWGRMLLTRRINLHLQRHTEAQYFVMRFDASPAGADAVKQKLLLDPRVVRSSIIKLQNQKLGAKFGQGLEMADDIRWTRKPAGQRGTEAWAEYWNA